VVSTSEIMFFSSAFVRVSIYCVSFFPPGTELRIEKAVI